MSLKAQNIRYRFLPEFPRQRHQRPFLPLLPNLLYRQKPPALR